MTLRDMDTKGKVRIGIDGSQPEHLTMYLDTPNGFWKYVLTHEEARRLAFLLMGSADPYPSEKNAT